MLYSMIMHLNLLSDSYVRDQGLLIGEGFWVLERIPVELIHEVYSTRGFQDRILALGINPERLNLLSSEELSSLAGFKFHRGVLSFAHRPVVRPIDEYSGKRALILVDLADPDNVGALIRSAVAFGCDAVIVTPACADVYSRKAIRCSMANVFSVPVYSLQTPQQLTHLQQRQVSLLSAATGPESKNIREFKEDHKDSVDSWALMLGNEGWGLPAIWRKHADYRVKVPMRPGVDSLNVAMAGSILLYELSGLSLEVFCEAENS